MVNYAMSISLWMALNEPEITISDGHADSAYSPGRCSDWGLCYAGDAKTWPYLVAKDLLLGHAAAF